MPKQPNDCMRGNKVALKQMFPSGLYFIGGGRLEHNSTLICTLPIGQAEKHWLCDLPKKLCD